MLASACYTAGEAFQLEKNAVFAHSWLPLGVDGQLRAPGSFVSATIGGWPLFAVRGTDGAVRAFRNTCRHKGMMVVEQPAGHCDALRCRYHGWTYGLDGRFREAPTAVAPQDADSPAHHLALVNVERWRDVLLVNLDSDAGGGDYRALEDAMAARGGAPAEYATLMISDIACNWKVCLEEALSDPAVVWHWPLLVLRLNGESTVVEQVIPRTFLRTRVAVHVFTRDGSGQQAVVDRERERADDFRRACEALQAARAEGRPMTHGDPRTEELHQRLRATYSRPAPNLET